MDQQNSNPLDTNDPLYLGLDLSTQQLKGILINSSGNIVKESNIGFDATFPHYHTTNGRHVHGDRVTAPVHMWLEALDHLMHEILLSGLGPRIHGISGAAQQHGSVYWNHWGIEQLANLDTNKSLKDQLVFAVADSPIWEDASTKEECRELEHVAGSAARLAEITGSVGFERFTGAQIAKIKKTPAWTNVSRVSLVSSFLASLLIGKIAPVDVSDASGTNLFDAQQETWSQGLCDSISSDLINMLGPRVCMADERVGTLSTYFVEKYGLHGCPIWAFSGDNPSAFAGFESIHRPGPSLAVLSLGTSDTVLFPLSAYPYVSKSALEHPDGHVMRHPTDRSRFIAMLCYKNGSLVREWVRDTYAHDNGSWAEFNRMAMEPLAPKAFGFYYPSMEIQPKAKGIHRFVQAADGKLISPTSGTRYTAVQEFNQTSDPRAILESQLMSMCVDYRHKSADPLPVVAVTGGASDNAVVRQAIADILGVRVCAVYMPSAECGVAPAMPAYGAAIRALSAAEGRSVDACVLRDVAVPRELVHKRYADALADFEFLRRHVSLQHV
ncbi:hypothetical protein LPJ66_002202 [Kickxella alabastrina]|uniref:Uncharacterized protein n=1 Tax=Kickxella alabastrina TaxID=61397 RepID=A0ACC1IR36_9FUNG|nr:hypothetical protein LPJ66_002202 [Kickxella alabastrina]